MKKICPVLMLHSSGNHRVNLFGSYRCSKGTLSLQKLFKLSFHAQATVRIVAPDGRKREQGTLANGLKSTSISMLRCAFYFQRDTLS